MGGNLVNGTWQFDQKNLDQFGKPNVVQQPEQQISATNQTTGKTMEQIMQDIVNAKNAQAQAGFNNAFEQARLRAEADRQALNPIYEQQQRQIGVNDTMARRYSENQLAQQGLAGSGAANQRTIEQNVLTQGSLGNLANSRAQAESAINRSLSDAQLARDLGIANANASGNVALLEGQLGIAQTNQANARADEQNALQRQIDTIGAYSDDFQAEINKRMAVNPNDPLIPYLKAARQDKLTGIAQAQQQREQTDYDRAIAEREQAIKDQERQAKIEIDLANLKLKQQAATKKNTTSTSTGSTSTKKDANTIVGAW
jgi:hypothetical protein